MQSRQEEPPPCRGPLSPRAEVRDRGKAWPREGTKSGETGPQPRFPVKRAPKAGTGLGTQLSLGPGGLGLREGLEASQKQ